MAEPSATSDASGLDELLAKGSDFLQKDKVQEARDCFALGLDLEPENEKLLGLLGLTHFRLDDFKAAKGVYEKLVKKKPDDASYRLNLGLVHLKLSNAVAAIEELDRSRELDPSQIRTISYLGLAYARNGEYAKAYDAFLRADQSALAAEMEQYLGEVERAGIRARVLDSQSEDEGLPMFGAAEESPAQESPAEESPAEESPAEESPAEESPAEESPAEASPAEASPAEASPAEASPAEASPAEASPAEASPAEASPAEESPAEESPAEASPAEESPAEAAPAPMAKGGMVSQAVEIAVPSPVAESHGVPIGHKAPQAISTLATQRLLRPSEGGQVLEIGAGGVLVARVNKKLISRTQGVMVSSGELGFEPATRRVRGQQSEEIFGRGDAKLFLVTGEGYMVASSCGEVFTAVRLDDDVLYLREEYVFAFDPELRWENGRIPGSDFHVAQFRGTGCVALRTPKEPLSVKLSADRVMYVESEVLAGWIGRVVPRLVKPAAGGRTSTPFVECSGEGVVLLHDMLGLR